MGEVWKKLEEVKKTVKIYLNLLIGENKKH